MYIKRYSIAAFIWIALVGWYVYVYISHDTTSIDIFGVHMPMLPVAAWIVAPLVVLYLGSVLHMSFYSMLGSFRLRGYEKDFEKIIDVIIDAYLGKQIRSYNFKTQRYKLLGKLLETSTIIPNGEFIGETGNAKIDKVLRIIDDIKHGKVVDLRSYNLLPENPLVIQNEKNRFQKGDISAADILANCTKYAESFCQYVYAEYVKTATLQNILKYKAFLTQDSLQEIIDRINSEKHPLTISNDELIELLKKFNYSKKEYMDLAITLSKAGMIPEQRMKLFEILSNENHEEVMDAYLFTLFDLEMIELADEILQNAHADEFENFRAYRALKECGKNFSIYLFV